MSKIEKLLKKSADLREFATCYYDYLSELLHTIDLDSIVAFIQEMKDARENHKTVFFIGNGGSAATASHLANDFGVNIIKKIGGSLQFRPLALTDNIPAMLAIGNDDGYEQLFVNQLRLYYQRGDKLVAISASGNSPNIIAAAEWVKSKGGAVMAFVGFDGGRLKKIADIAIHVNSISGEYGPVEDIHLIMGHLLSYWLEHLIKNDKVETKGI